MLELVRVARRFDASRGAEFALYAYPCILGAVKDTFATTAGACTTSAAW